MSTCLSIRLYLTAATLTSTLACVDPDEPALGVTEALLGCNDGVAQIAELCAAPPTTVLETASPLATVLAVDINGDALRDVVGVDATRLYVRLRAAAGFGVWSSYQPPGGPLFRDVAAGDFDGDGEPDVAAVDFANDRLVVRLHTVGASFAPAVFFPTADGPIRVLAARIDGDARDDLVVLNDNANTLQVFFAGAFGAPVSYPVGTARDLAVGDCDGNGETDVMYLNSSGAATELHARRNFGGNLGMLALSPFPFIPTVPIPFFSAPLAIVSGRMNADAVDDVVVSAEWSRLVTGRSNGNCTFAKLPEVQTYAWTYRLRLGDHDGNGALDVAAPHYTDPADDELSVVFGVGNGNLIPAYGLLQLPTGTVFNDTAFGDFNSDGARDLITASRPGFLLHRGTP